MPDRDYYLSDDAKLKGIREKYEPYVRDLLALAETPDAGGRRQEDLRDRVAHRYRALDARAESRRREDLQPLRPRGAREADAGIRLGCVPARRADPERESGGRQRDAAELLRGARQDLRRGAGRRLARLLPLQAAEHLRAGPAGEVRAAAVRVQRPHGVGHRRAEAALEARRRHHRRRGRRPGRQDVRRAPLQAGAEAAHRRAGQ